MEQHTICKSGCQILRLYIAAAQPFESFVQVIEAELAAAE
jgi:hypothetical protein